MSLIHLKDFRIRQMNGILELLVVLMLRHNPFPF
jgi:hypothetical protein